MNLKLCVELQYDGLYIDAKAQSNLDGREANKGLLSTLEDVLLVPTGLNFCFELLLIGFSSADATSRFTLMCQRSSAFTRRKAIYHLSFEALPGEVASLVILAWGEERREKER